MRRKLIVYTGSDNDAYRQLCNTVGMGGLTKIIEHVNKLNAVGIISAFKLPKDLAEVRVPTSTALTQQQGNRDESELNGGNQLGNITAPATAGSTEDTISVQCEVRQGTLALNIGATHEVIIEVDPDRISAVRWKFEH